MGSLFETLMGFIADALEWFGVGLVNLIVDLVNAAIAMVAAVLGAMIALLPSQDMSFQPPQSLLDVMSWVNWFVPVSSLLACLSIMAVSYAGFFTIKPVLKFFRLT